MEGILASKAKVKSIIVGELEAVAQKYGQPRRSMILYADEVEEAQVEEEVPDYPVHLFFTKEGYFKKITPQSLRMSGEQKYKDGDGPFLTWEASNRDELLVFTDRQQCYRPGSANLRTPRPAPWATTCPPSWVWTRGERGEYGAAGRLRRGAAVLL